MARKPTTAIPPRSLIEKIKPRHRQEIEPHSWLADLHNLEGVVVLIMPKPMLPIPIPYEREWTVGRLKIKVSDRTGIPVANQRLFVGPNELTDKLLVRHVTPQKWVSLAIKRSTGQAETRSGQQLPGHRHDAF